MSRIRAPRGALLRGVSTLAAVILVATMLAVPVAASGQPPVFDPVAPQTVAEGATLQVNLHATDPEGDPLILFQNAVYPVLLGASFTDDGGGNAHITFAPTSGAAAGSPYTILSRAFDGTNLAAVSFTLTVTAGSTNNPPVLDPIGPQSVTEQHVLNVPISASDADGDTLTIDMGSHPGFASLTDNGDGTATLHLAPVIGDAAGSPYTITIGVADQVDSDSEDVQVTVVANKRPTVDGFLPETMAEGATLDVPIMATDPDGDDITLSTSILDPSLHAVFTDNGDGTGNLHFAPDFTANAGSPYSITVWAEDAWTTSPDSSILQLTVTNVSGNPVITVPSDITTDATSAAGAVVDFTVNATDPEDGPLTPDCDHSSGDTFPIGTTLVTCTATDADTNTATDSFSITVVDTAPVIAAQGGGALPDVTVKASSKNGTVVTFSAVATDAVDGPVAVDCTPASGSLFPVGQTQVVCTATDSADNTARATFVVTVGPSASVSVPPTSTLPSTTPTAPGTGYLPVILAVLGLTGLAGATLTTRRRRS
jgi:hypothetical protein